MLSNKISELESSLKQPVTLMKNDDFCFAPIQERNPQFMPPSETEIFVPGTNNEVFIYTVLVDRMWGYFLDVFC